MMLASYLNFNGQELACCCAVNCGVYSRFKKGSRMKFRIYRFPKDEAIGEDVVSSNKPERLVSY